MHDFLSFNEGAATPFSGAHLAAAPVASGVYFLYRNERLVYVGAAVHGAGIRQELENHLRGSYGAATRAATAFRYELTRNPVVAKHQYLQAHKERFGGRFPACNTPERALA